MAKLNTRNKEILSRGKNVFIGEMEEGDFLVVLKQKDSYMSVVVSNVDVPRVGKQTYFLVKDVDKINELVFKSLMIAICDKFDIKVSSKIAVANQDDGEEELSRKVLADRNQLMFDKGIDPIDEADITKFLDEEGWEADFTYTEVEVNVSATLHAKPFNPKTTIHESDTEELILLNEKATRLIDIKDNYNLMNTLEAMKSGVARNILFTGDAGTGKTSAFYKMCALAGAVPMSFNASTNVDEDFAFGSYVINDDPKSESRYKWLQGIFTKAYKNGYWLLIDEANMIQDGGVLAPMNNAIAPPYKLELPNGETVKMHPNFRLVLAMNIGYNHTYELNQALADRLQRKLRFPDLTLDETFSRLKTKLGFTNRRVVEKLYDIYESLKALAVREGVSAVISYRGIEDCISQASVTGDIKDALNATLFESIFYEITDESVVEAARDSLKADIEDLHRLYTGTGSKDLKDMNEFDFSSDNSEDVEDTDELLDALDKM